MFVTCYLFTNFTSNWNKGSRGMKFFIWSNLTKLTTTQHNLTLLFFVGRGGARPSFGLNIPVSTQQKFWPRKIFWPKKCFDPKNIFDPKFFFHRNFFQSEYFSTQNFFLTQKIFKQKKISTQKFRIAFFDQKIFSTKKFLRPKKFSAKIFLTQKIF